jgi:hypothetical protein
MLEPVPQSSATDERSMVNGAMVDVAAGSPEGKDQVHLVRPRAAKPAIER